MSIAPREHVSVSFLQTIQRCGMQAKFRYVDGIKVPPGVAMIRGDGVHEAVAKNMRAKRDEGRLLSGEELSDAVSDAIDLKVADGLAMTAEEEALGVKRVVGAVKDEAISLVGLHAREFAPKINPEFVEAEITSAEPLDQLGGKKLVARIDLADVDGTVRDTKTTKRSISVREAEVSEQLSAYAFAYSLAKGRLPKETRLDVLVALKSGTKTQALVAPRAWPQINATLDAMGRAQQVFDSGIFLPTNPSNWWCSKKWCGYASMCPFYVKEADKNE